MEEERRAARIGTVSGLALLVGGTAVAAVSRGTHSIFATILLGLLALGMAHALVDEIRRQARRRVGVWVAHDTANTMLLASWSGAALITSVLAVIPATVRAVGLALSLGYAVSCSYFVIERRRTITTIAGSTSPPASPSATQGLRVEAVGVQVAGIDGPGVDGRVVQDLVDELGGAADQGGVEVDLGGDAPEPVSGPEQVR